MKIKFIINPSSGFQDHERQLQKINELLTLNHQVDRVYTQEQDDAKVHALNAINDEYDCIIVSGGDGTVNEIANAVGTTKSKIPVAILPNGTVNDFAKYLDTPTDPEEFVHMLEEFKTVDVDLGCINNNYFANVAAIGSISQIAHEVEKETKAVLGKLAYYLEGIKKIPDIFNKTINIKLVTNEFAYEEESIVLMISNTSSIGGFKKLAPRARITDGYFDVILIKKTDLLGAADVFLKTLSGEHINNENVLYFHTDHLVVTAIEDEDIPLDIDGEHGGFLPAEFSVLPAQFRLIIDTNIEGV